MPEMVETQNKDAPGRQIHRDKGIYQVHYARVEMIWPDEHINLLAWNPATCELCIYYMTKILLQCLEKVTVKVFS